MAQLTITPYDYDLQLVTPKQQFTAVSNRVYHNYFAGQRVDLTLRFNNLQRRDFYQLVAETSMLESAGPSGSPYTGSRAGYLSSGYFMFVPLAVLGNMPITVISTATVVSIVGNVVTLSRSTSNVLVGQWVSIGDQLMMVQARSGNSLTVTPRTMAHTVPGDPALRAGQGGWFTLAGDLPAWRYKPAQVQYGAPYTLELQGVV